MTGEAKLPGHEFELRIPWWHITLYLFLFTLFFKSFFIVLFATYSYT